MTKEIFYIVRGHYKDGRIKIERQFDTLKSRGKHAGAQDYFNRMTREKDVLNLEIVRVIVTSYRTASLITHYKRKETKV